MLTALRLACLCLWLAAAPVWAASCGGVGEPACPPAPISPPAPPVLVPTPLGVSIGVPACVLETPPCFNFTVEVQFVLVVPAPAATPVRTPARAPAAFFQPQIPADIQAPCDHPGTRKCPSGTLPVPRP